MRLENKQDRHTLKTRWQTMDWDAAEKALARHQRDIALAAQKRDWRRVTIAQIRLTTSTEARVLAIRHACKSASSGMDRVTWKTDAEKMDAALSLSASGYRASPLRVIKLTIAGKERVIHIPTYRDRAMQTLYSYALDPVAESTGERKSFAFRKSRSYLDAHTYIIRAIEALPSTGYVIKADVKACYSKIRHQWLLNNIPMEKRVLKQFIKAKHFWGGRIFPAGDEGISLGSPISPIIANITLDRMQSAIYKGLHGVRDDKVDINFVDGNLIRYADDLVITACTYETAEKILAILTEFLAVRGLELSPHKTEIISIANGFDFLSRNYKYVQGCVLSTPSSNSVARVKRTLYDFISSCTHKAQDDIIVKLNEILSGWASYHKISNAKDAFRSVDSYVTSLLLYQTERIYKHKMSIKEIKDTFFIEDRNGQYVYVHEKKPNLRVSQLARVILIRHNPVLTYKNPYIDYKYFQEREQSRKMTNISGKFKRIWERQNGLCAICERDILADEQRSLVLIDPNGAHNRESNSAYVHLDCRNIGVEYYNDDNIEDAPDIVELLNVLRKGQETAGIKRSARPYLHLLNYFKLKTEPVFTLTIPEIEAIIGKKICDTWKKVAQFWRGSSTIHYCWADNGYSIKELDLTNQKITFELIEAKNRVLEIPDELLLPDAPIEVIEEINTHIKRVLKKHRAALTGQRTRRGGRKAAL
jgi:RNA-directed DNA polymerase